MSRRSVAVPEADPRPRVDPETEARSPQQVSTVTCFSVLARAEPGVMPRILQLFAKRNLVPSRWHSDLVTGDGGRQGDLDSLTIDLQVVGLTRHEASYIARSLRQLFDVEAVLTSEKIMG